VKRLRKLFGDAPVAHGLRRASGAVVAVALVTAACPQGTELITRFGAGSGGGGGAGTPGMFFRVQPSSNTTAGNIITPAIQITVVDTSGSVDSSFSAAVTLNLGNNPTGANLTGTLSVVPTFGTAVFGDLRLDKAGKAYSLQASAPGATGATSAPFNIN
jgi:hypothetical protein